MDRELDQINVVPLVDVMLVLLVIVLTSATFITTGHIPVDLAAAKESGDRHDVPLVITVTKEEGMFVNDQPVPGEDLDTLLRSFSRESQIVVRADRAIVLERFVGVVDEVRSLGFQDVSLEVARP